MLLLMLICEFIVFMTSSVLVCVYSAQVLLCSLCSLNSVLRFCSFVLVFRFRFMFMILFPSQSCLMSLRSLCSVFPLFSVKSTSLCHTSCFTLTFPCLMSVFLVLLPLGPVMFDYSQLCSPPLFHSLVIPQCF